MQIISAVVPVKLSGKIIDTKDSDTNWTTEPLSAQTIVNVAEAEAWLRRHTRYKNGAFLFSKDLRDTHGVTLGKMRYYHLAISKIYKNKAVYDVINKFRGWKNIEVKCKMLEILVNIVQLMHESISGSRVKEAPQPDLPKSAPPESSDLDPQSAAEEWVRKNIQLQHGKFLPSRRIMALRKCTKYDMRYMHPAIQKVFSGLAILCMRKMMRGWLHVEVCTVIISIYS